MIWCISPGACRALHIFPAGLPASNASSSGPPYSPSPLGAEAAVPASARLGYSAPSSAFLAETILASTAAAILASRAAILASFAVAAASRQPFQALIKRSHTEKHTKTPYQHTNSFFLTVMFIKMYSIITSHLITHQNPFRPIFYIFLLTNSPDCLGRPPGAVA